MNNEPTINQQLDDEPSGSGKTGSGYQSEADSVEQSISEDTDNPWVTDNFQDGYQENVFEVNFGDTPYTESAAHPNPKLPGYSSGSGYKSQKCQQSASPELEL
ncbi:hypothetical protein [Anabaena sp. CCY 0017]|uniref:hypothetical protein n=1 Tax=Anabaena sp. CCY 0017 TaxID=3103866 RepID=UPI0039C724C3